MDAQFSTGEVIARTLVVSAKHAPVLAVLVLLVYAPALILLLVAGGQDKSGDQLLAFAVEFLLSWFLAGLATGTLTAGVLQALTDRRPGFWAMVRGGIR